MLDVDLNRDLCVQFLSHLDTVLQMTECGEMQSPSGSESLPGWVSLLFGGKEGLAGAYIRLSQQQLRIAAVQMQLSQGREPQTPVLTKDDMKTLRYLIQELEPEEVESEQNKAEED